MQGSTAYILAIQEAESLVASALSGIVSHSVDDVNKTITFTFSDSTSATLTFSQPSDGNGITSTALDSNYHFVITYDNGNTEDAGSVPYQTNARIDTTTNHLIIVLTDGTEIDAGELPVGTVDTSKYLSKDNTTAYTPTGDYNPATKKYVDDITGDLTALTVTGVNDIVEAINKLDASFMKNITYSNKKLTIEYKNGNIIEIDVSSIITDTNIEELSNVVVSNMQNGDVLMYDSASNKFVNKQVSTTDEKVKMTSGDSSGDYLENLIDGTTIENVSGKLVAKTLDGQTITIAELNTLKGMDANVKDTLDSIASGGMRFKDVVPTYADLPSTADNGDVYIVSVDETSSSNDRNAYIYSDTHAGFVLVGKSGLEVRNFTTNPIDLTSEVVNKLPAANIEVDEVLEQLSTSQEYKTLTTDAEVFNTHGANAMYNEVLTELSGKVNTSDIVDNLTSESTDKPLSANQGKVLKEQVDNAASDFTTHTDNSDIHVTKTFKDDVDTHIADTVAHLTQAERDNLLTKDDIVEDISKTPSDEKVVSEKAIYNNYHLKTYIHMSQLGLSTGCTLDDILNAMTDYSVITVNSSYLATDDRPTVSTSGSLITITRLWHSRISIVATDGNGNVQTGITSYSGTTVTFGGWKKVLSEDDTNLIDLDLTYYNSDSLNINLPKPGFYKISKPTEGVPDGNPQDYVLLNIPWQKNNSGKMAYANQLLFTPRKKGFWHRRVWNYDPDTYTYTEGDYTVFANWNKVHMGYDDSLNQSITTLSSDTLTTGAVRYSVKNGMCTLTLDGVTFSSTSSACIVTDAAPKNAAGYVCGTLTTVEGEVGGRFSIVNASTNINARASVIGSKLSGSICYPVSE